MRKSAYVDVYQLLNRSILLLRINFCRKFVEKIKTTFLK